jgi:hypothetical protein
MCVYGSMTLSIYNVWCVCIYMDTDVCMYVWGHTHMASEQLNSCTDPPMLIICGVLIQEVFHQTYTLSHTCALWSRWWSRLSVNVSILALIWSELRTTTSCPTMRLIWWSPYVWIETSCNTCDCATPSPAHKGAQQWLQRNVSCLGNRDRCAYVWRP